MTAQNAGGVDARSPFRVAVNSLIESARCLAIAQVNKDAAAAEHWESEVQRHKAALSAVSPDAATVDDAPEGWRPCKRGTKCTRTPDCICGGSGWRKKCNSNDCAEYGCDGGKHCYVSPAEVSAALQAARVPDGGKVDAGNLASDPLYLALDALFSRGWTDKHKGRDYDPRGTNEWQAVLDLFRAHGRVPDGAGGKAVAEIRGIDEYGPMIDWHTHWVEVGVGAKLYTHPAPEPSLSREGASVSNAVRGLVEIAELCRTYALAAQEGGREAIVSAAFLTVAQKIDALATPNPATLAETAESVDGLWPVGVDAWFAECRRVLEDVATEMRATGRGETRFRRLIDTMPRLTPASTKKRVDKLRGRDAEDSSK